VGSIASTDLWCLATALTDRRPFAVADPLATAGRPCRAWQVLQLWMPVVRRGVRWGAHVPRLRPFS